MDSDLHQPDAQRHLHVGEGLPQAEVGSSTVGRIGAGGIVLRARFRVAVDVEALRGGQRTRP